jgi:SRSO17 transposase
LAIGCQFSDNPGLDTHEEAALPDRSPVRTQPWSARVQEPSHWEAKQRSVRMK